MSGAIAVAWHTDALEAWRRLSFDDASVVATAVDRFARGDAVGIVVAHGPYEFLLMVEAYVVVLIHDPVAGILYVGDIRSA